MTHSYAKKGKRTTRSTVKRFNVMVDPTLLEQLDQFCKDYDYKRNHLMDVMLTEFLDKWGTSDTKINPDRDNPLSQSNVRDTLQSSIRNEKEAADFMHQLKAVQDSQKKQ